MELSPAVNVFRLSQSNYVVLVREINVAHCNNYCSTLTFLGLSLYLIGQLTFALVMSTDDGLLGADRCTNLMQCVAIIIAVPYSV